MAMRTLDSGNIDAVEILGRAQSVMDSALRAAVGTLPPRARHIAGYHFGWWDRYGAAQAGGGGKAIRPALVLAAARAAAGGPVPGDGIGLPAAVAVELVHNFTLLHDDVIDDDTQRRGRETAWSVFGTADAILAGDALQALAAALLAEDRGSAAAPAAVRLNRCVIELCEGQSADVAFETRTDVTLAECLAMAQRKTGALLGCACAMGALYGGAEPAAVEALDSFGRRVGLAFQLIDDLLGIWGDPRVTGKSASADLAARKKSLPVVAALTSGTPEGADLAELYGGESPLDADEVVRAAQLVERAGGRSWAQATAEAQITAALGDLATAFPDPTRARELRVMAEFITRRDR